MLHRRSSDLSHNDNKKEIYIQQCMLLNFIEFYIILLNFNCKERTCLKEVIHQMNKKYGCYLSFF